MRLSPVRIIGEDIAFGVTVSAEGCRVMADRPQLEQLVVNLVVNSRDALSEAGAISVDVKPVQVAQAAVPGSRGRASGRQLVRSPG